jgi:threonine dehydratase
LATALALSNGLTFIPPFDHADVLSGQGTAALELFQEVGELDVLFVCLGGGGLLSGSALAAKALSPSCQIVGVEPEAGNDVQQSFRKGERVKIATPVTIADGAQTPMVGAITFEIIKALVDDIHTVTDAQLVQSMRFYAERMKMIVEPTGCLSLAAAKQASESLKGKKVGVVVSGGNIDMARFLQLMTAYP